MIFFYDITRFIARLDENTPTGIDRVDIHYAKSILDSKKEIYYFFYNPIRIIKASQMII